MKLSVRTRVNLPMQGVREGFTRDLFKRVNPPFPPVSIVRYDGMEKGDLIHLELNFLLFKQSWVSRISANQTSDEEFFFIDEGLVLPFFLKHWHHKHRIVKDGKSSMIIDEVNFRAPFFFADWLMWPFFYLLFLYRKPIYRRYFAGKG